MGLLKRLVGEPTPSQEDLQRQAAEEIKQMLGEAPTPPRETQSAAMDQAVAADHPSVQGKAS